MFTTAEEIPTAAVRRGRRPGAAEPATASTAALDSQIFEWSAAREIRATAWSRAGVGVACTASYTA